LEKAKIDGLEDLTSWPDYTIISREEFSQKLIGLVKNIQHYTESLNPSVKTDINWKNYYFVTHHNKILIDRIIIN